MMSASSGLAGGEDPLLHELAGHALAVQLVHLAAPGLDEEAAGGVIAGLRRGEA